MEKQQALVDNVDDEKHGNLQHFQRGILATGCQTWKSKQGLVDDVDKENQENNSHWVPNLERRMGARRRCRRRKPWKSSALSARGNRRS